MSENNKIGTYKFVAEPFHAVIILLSNRTLTARKRPVYKAFQKFLIIQTRRVLC